MAVRTRKQQDDASEQAASSSGAVWAQLLGPKLLRHGGGGGSGSSGELEAVDTASALAGKHVGLYFSAHWCERGATSRAPAHIP